MLDKNPQQNQIQKYSDLSKILEKNTFNSILYSDPFLKAVFLKEIIPEINSPIIFLDFDLLFSGYLISGSISKPNNLFLFQPNKENWQESLKEIFKKLSEQKSFLIIDSLNNFFNMFENNSDVGRLVNSYIMLLISSAKMSESNICLLSMARKDDDENMVLSISGRKIPQTTYMTLLQFDQTDSELKVTISFQKNEFNSFLLPIKSDLV